MRSKSWLTSILLIVVLLCLYGCSTPASSNGDTGQDIGRSSGYTGLESETRQTQDTGTKEEQKVEGSEIQEEKPADVNKLSITLYYRDSENCLIPVTRRVARQEGIARAAINGLIDNALNREGIEYFGLYPVLPKGTEILGINIKEGLGTIDFNNEFLKYASETDERSIIASVVYTLTEFKTIEGVRILVNGYAKEKLKYGTDISGVLNRSNVLINAARVNLKEGLKKADVYLLKNIRDSFVYILPCSKEYSGTADENLPAEIAGFLKETAGDGNLYSEIPPEVKLVGSSIKNGLLTVNFNEEILNYGGRSKEDGILSQILYSMKQIKGVERIRILVDGKALVLPEGTDISREIPVPAVINDIIDK